MPTTLPVLALAWGLTFAGAAVHGTIGMGIALVSVPVLALVDPALVPVPQMILAMVLNGFLFWKERGALDRSGLGWVIAGRVPGAVLGAWLVAVLGTRLLSITVAVTILAAVALLASGVTVARSLVKRGILLAASSRRARAVWRVSSAVRLASAQPAPRS